MRDLQRVLFPGRSFGKIKFSIKDHDLDIILDKIEEELSKNEVCFIVMGSGDLFSSTGDGNHVYIADSYLWSYLFQIRSFDKWRDRLIKAVLEDGWNEAVQS